MDRPAPPPAAQAPALPAAYAVLLLVLAAMLLMAPSYLFFPNFADSFKYNYTWLTQIDAAVARGQFPIRWLPDSFAHFGSPAFYFYPPAAFDLTAWLTAPLGGLLSTRARLAVGATAALAGSGAAMYYWLRAQASSRGAMIGALAYMAMPYHLFDWYVRNAYAEFVAFVFIPLVALAMECIRQGRRFGVPLLAVSYAALITCHLPVALLTSCTLIPAYVLYRGIPLTGAAAASFFAQIAMGLGLGLLIAGFYLAPALGLQRFVSIDRWSSPELQVQSWYFLSFSHWPNPVRELIVISLSAAALVLCLTAALAAARGGERRLLFWAALGLACVLIIAGWAPGFWSIPVLQKVQFPWRLLAVVDFVCATVIGMGALKGVKFAAVAALAALAVPGISLAVLLAAHCAPPGKISERLTAYLDLTHPDAVEYMPAGVKITQIESLSGIPSEQSRNQPLVAGSGASAISRDDGSLLVHVDSREPGRVVVRRYFFPAWRVRQGAATLAVAPFGPDRLVSFLAPAGAADYVVSIAPTGEERLGWALSVAGVTLTGAWLAVTGFLALRRRRGVPPTGSAAV